MSEINIFFSGNGIEVVVLKVLLSVVCGGVLGWERTRKRRPAGTRTYMLVSLGATLVSMTGLYIVEYIGVSDPARLSAQVISGIGFIGAGTIICNGYHQIKGLTTAAGLWVAACLGLSIGMGFVVGAIIVCLTILLVLVVFGHLENSYFERSNIMKLVVVFKEGASPSYVFEFLKSEPRFKLTDFELLEGFDKKCFLVSLKLLAERDKERVLEDIKELDGVSYADQI